jgi:hypothetical protein
VYVNHQAQRLIFSKSTTPGGETTLYVDGIGSIVTEISPTLIKMDNAMGLKTLWVRNAPVVATQPAVMMQPAGQSPADKIRALKALMDDGIISDKEFEAKKEAILASM